MWAKYKNNSGFTIVELLIVIVVIAILAAISIVAYRGIQSRTNDSAVQSDMKNLVKQLEMYRVDNGVYPVGDTQLMSLIGGIKMSKTNYGNGFSSNTHNFVYCRVAADGPDKFALVVSSKSGNIFTYQSATGGFTTTTSWAGTSSVTICNAAGINQVLGTDRDILYYNNAWLTYIGG
jgi:prepilin-type N-terminal cleavage/methylation domain-containing protein